MWIRNVAEARFTGDLLVGLVTNLHEQKIRRRSKLCELGPHTIKVSILVEMDGEYSQWRVRGPARGPERICPEWTSTYTICVGENAEQVHAN